MTSKEALKDLLKMADYCLEEKDRKQLRKEYDIVLKDLKVLEILKKWVLVNETYDDLFPYEIKVKKGYVSSKSCLVLAEEEFKKIKEWLGNEKDNI